MRRYDPNIEPDGNIFTDTATDEEQPRTLKIEQDEIRSAMQLQLGRLMLSSMVAMREHQHRTGTANDFDERFGTLGRNIDGLIVNCGEAFADAVEEHGDALISPEGAERIRKLSRDLIAMEQIKQQLRDILSDFESDAEGN